LITFDVKEGFVMLSAERRERIINYLSHHEVLSVQDAIECFDASPATIRRDFNEMAQQGLVNRIHGGIKISKAMAGDILPFNLREDRYSAEKEALCIQAAKLLYPGDAVIIDGGTTPYFIATHLPDFPLRVITNSLRLAATLEAGRMQRMNMDIYITGGNLYPNSGVLLGPNAVASLKQYHANWAILSVGGITEQEVSNTNDLVVETERTMLDHADQVMVLADHSKLGLRAMTHLCGLDRIHYLITDNWPASKPLLDKIADMGVKVITTDVARPVTH
jgi:DeoR/GlpR family transcriptional regulator of sugar metabolism